MIPNEWVRMEDAMADLMPMNVLVRRDDSDAVVSLAAQEDGRGEEEGLVIMHPLGFWPGIQN